MNRDIVIGKGGFLNSAWLVRDFVENPLYISANSVSFWISGAFLNSSLYVMKDTKEGLILIDLIAGGSDKQVINFVETLVIENLTPTKLKAKIKESCKESFELGRAHQIALLRQAMGLL